MSYRYDRIETIKEETQKTSQEDLIDIVIDVV
jgi:hypothetical protein